MTNYVVCKYGCNSPIQNDELMIEQIKLRNRYWNDLVTIHNEYLIDGYRKIVWVPERDVLDEMYSRLNDLRNEIDRERQFSRNSKDETEYIKSCKAKVSVLKREIKAYKKKHYNPALEKHKERDDVKKQIAENNQAYHDLLKKSRREKVADGLYWQNYDDIDRNYNKSICKKSLESGNKLNYHRFDGSGKVNIRLKGSDYVLTDKVYDGQNQYFQIDPVDSRAWTSESRKERRSFYKTNIRIRIKSEKRCPVWLELPMYMHRPLPEGEIRKISVQREVIAGKPRYSVSITVKVPKVIPTINDDKPSVGIDIGWRLIGCHAIRVAYWYASDGSHGEFVIDKEIVSQLSKVNDIRSIRDKNFDKIKAELQKFVRNNNIPEWLKKEKYINHPKWNSIAKLVKLFKYKWVRFDGDEEIYNAISDWYERWETVNKNGEDSKGCKVKKGEKHLYEYEGNLRDQVHTYRREHYRIFASRIAIWFGRVYMEKFNLSEMAEKPKSEKGTKKSVPPNKYRVMAAPSTLRNAIEAACLRDGVYHRRVEPHYTTQECHQCGFTEKFNAAAQIDRECPNCGLRWDQDYNAARLILRRGLEEDM